MRWLDIPCLGELLSGTSLSGAEMEIRVGRSTILDRPYCRCYRGVYFIVGF